MRKIYLASASERRQEILKKAGIDYVKMVANVNEETDETRPEKAVEEISRRKGCYVAQHVSQYDGYLVIAADTLVYVDGELLGKPDDEEQAREGLKMISGREHQVVTGVSIFYDLHDMDGTRLHKSYTFHSVTKVYVAELSERDIDDYIDSEEWKGKAGGYAIQGRFCRYVTGIDGEYENVVGFPIARFYSETKKLGLL